MSSCAEWNSLDPAAKAAATALATAGLWAATGRRFGLCQVTVQPCRPQVEPPLYQTFPVHPGYSDGGGLTFPVLQAGQWFNRCGPSCTCRARCEIALNGPTTKANIVEVKVGGAAVDPQAYQVHDQHLLVRIDGACWPSCVDYSVQNPPEFEVTYRRGEPIPADVLVAAGVFACELAKGIAGGECALPAQITRLSRQGVEVSVAEITSYLDRGLTQIEAVDRVIAVHNPERHTSRPDVWSPDLPRPRMVT